MKLERFGDAWRVRFAALGGPCEILIDGGEYDQALAAGEAAASVAWRIERKFSRYRDDSVVSAINRAAGTDTEVDGETARLLDFAATIHGLSDGRFDITSGALRRVWTFDGKSRVPSQAEIDAVLPLVGWHRVRWRSPLLTLAPQMEIDFGGIGKEYAVDQALDAARKCASAAVLVNFGGDLAVTDPRRAGRPWRVGIEAARGRALGAATLTDLSRGALATSGGTHRYIEVDGKRLSHILDPITGRPVADAPATVTVAAPTCSQAGMLTTLAMLRGAQAEDFLRDEAVPHWIQRSFR